MGLGTDHFSLFDQLAESVWYARLLVKEKTYSKTVIIVVILLFQKSLLALTFTSRRLTDHTDHQPTTEM